MRVSIKTPVKREDGIELKEIGIDKVVVPERAVMSIDGSTTNTGIGILKESDGSIYYVIAATREKEETPVQYKVRLKRFIEDILLRNGNICRVYYEEPFIGYAVSAASLLMLRTFIEELIVENEPKLDYIQYEEISNKKWKRLFLYPTKCPSNSKLEKKLVRDKMLSGLPFLKDCTQDEIDSLAMGYIATVQISKGLEEDLKSNKKPRPFKYEVRFVGADEDDSVFMDFMQFYNGPEDILENGIVFRELLGRERFENKIYELMGNDDKVLVLKFSSNTHGNIILQYKIGNLAADYKYIYAIIWRKYRR